jgi:hypothetical protein
MVNGAYLLPGDCDELVTITTIAMLHVYVCGKSKFLKFLKKKL